MSGKVKYNSLTENEKKKFLGEFYSMVALLENREEVKNFLKDLLTLSEVVMISRRIQIAEMLLEGYTMEQIRGKLRVGYSTINYVEKWLKNGCGGYKKIIARYNKKSKSKYHKDKYLEPFTPDWVKNKYPAHYFLANLLANKANK